MADTCGSCGQPFHRYQWPLCPHEDELGRYVGPKMTVWAAKILRIDPPPENLRAYPSGAPIKDSGAELILDVANPMPMTDQRGVSVDDEWLEDNEPVVGGYYCLNSEGNESYVPDEVFRKHYKPVD